MGPAVLPGAIGRRLTLVLLLGASACTNVSPSTAHQTPSPSGSSSTQSAPARSRPELEIHRAPWLLPEPRSREVAIVQAGSIYILGGLSASGASMDSIIAIDPATGRTRSAGKLAIPAHDAGGAVLGGAAFVFGGGEKKTVDAVQRVTSSGTSIVGHLPSPRSDLSVVERDGVAYIVGGFDGMTYLRPVLSTLDGVHFRTLALLAVAVRYAAVVAVNDSIYVFGGVLPNGESDAVQRIDLATGRCSIVARLERSLSHSSAIVAGADVYLIGGRHGTRRVDDVLLFRTATAATTRAGALPYNVGDAAIASVAGHAFLLGGETPATTAKVVELSAF